MLERKDSRQDTTTTTGTGTVNLAGASEDNGYLPFDFTGGATVRYRIENADNSEWEVGEGVFSTGTPNTLTRATIYASSNSGSAVDFSAGTKKVFCVLVSEDLDPATGTDINTGTDDEKFVTPKAMADSDYAKWSDIYPVGAVYISVVSTSPATLFGGTWSAFAQGRTLVGLNSADTDFDTVEETGGSKTHTLTSDEIPSHDHQTIADSLAFIGSTSTNRKITYNTVSGTGNALGTAPGDVSTGASGGGSAHNNLQPYIVTYMWKRTA